MRAERPTQLVDPVCGMTVNVATAEEAGLLLERDGRTFAFCGVGCKRSFVEGPEEYVARAEAATLAAESPRALPMVDEGMRWWWELLVLPRRHLPGDQGPARRRARGRLAAAG